MDPVEDHICQPYRFSRESPVFNYLLSVSSWFHISPLFLLIYCVTKPVFNMVTVQHVLALRLLKPAVSTQITVQMHQARHVPNSQTAKRKLDKREKKESSFPHGRQEVCHTDFSVGNGIK